MLLILFSMLFPLLIPRLVFAICVHELMRLLVVAVVVACGIVLIPLFSACFQIFIGLSSVVRCVSCSCGILLVSIPLSTAIVYVSELICVCFFHSSSAEELSS